MSVHSTTLNETLNLNEIFLFLTEKIYKSLDESNLKGRLFLTGNTYADIGVNDCIFGSRKLVQNVLSKVIV